MSDEKRTADLKIYVKPTIEQYLVELAKREGRSISAYCSRVFEEHIAVKIVQRKISTSPQGN